MNKELKVIEFEKREIGTLRRLLRAELHEMLNTDINSWGLGFKEEHEKLVKYKFKLLKKLGSSDTLQKIKIYETHC